MGFLWTWIQDKINLISICLVWKTLRVIPAGRCFVFHWPILHCWLVCIFHWKYQGQNLGKWPTNSWTADQEEKKNNEDKHNFIAILKTCLKAFICNWLIVILGIWKKSKPNQKMALFSLNSFQTKSHSRFTAHLTLTHNYPKNGKHEVPNITLSSCSYWGTPHSCCKKGWYMFEIAFFHSVLILKTSYLTKLLDKHILSWQLSNSTAERHFISSVCIKKHLKEYTNIW